jgi:hypothetical protein
MGTEISTLRRAELSVLHPNIVQVEKSRRMKWAEYVAPMLVQRVLEEKPEGKGPMGDQDIDGN